MANYSIIWDATFLRIFWWTGLERIRVKVGSDERFMEGFLYSIVDFKIFPGNSLRGALFKDALPLFRGCTYCTPSVQGMFLLHSLCSGDALIAL